MRMRKLYEAMEYASPMQKEKIWDVIDEVFAEIKRKFPAYYNKYETKLCDILEEGHQSFRGYDDEDYDSSRRHQGAVGYIHHSPYDMRDRMPERYNRYR